MRYIFLVLCVFQLELAFCQGIIPQPQTLVKKNFTIDLYGFSYHTDVPTLRKEMDLFNEGLQKNNYGMIPYSDVKEKKKQLRLIIDTSFFPEQTGSYSLQMEKELITINANSDKGIFYGLQSLRQLVDPALRKQINMPPVVHAVDVEKDFPRFSYRGMHLDVCRHFFSVDEIKRYLDQMASLKLNVFHWHLTEDQGWRIEIKKYPELTRTGAFRNGSMIGKYSDQKFDTIRYGGFYSQDEIREIVQYAADRKITVVPEIELPGHSLAALASYPYLGCTGGPYEVAKGWGVFEDVYCTRDTVFRFLEDVLSEVMDLFPGEYIHIGGDECPKERWKKCEHCQKRIKDEGLKDEHELQSYFIRRIEKFVNSKGKKIIGWDEILEGGLAPNATVMSWRGTEGGIEAARQKHDVIMTPGSHCYFDHYQTNPDNDMLSIGGYTTIEKVYAYEPVPSELNRDETAFILGAQGNVWTEYMYSFRDVQFKSYPRMAALSEVLWTNPSQKKLSNFLYRFHALSKHWDEQSIPYSKSYLHPRMKFEENGKEWDITLSSPFEDAKIYVRTESENPGPFVLYKEPFRINRSTRMRAKLELPDGTIFDEFYIMHPINK